MVSCGPPVGSFEKCLIDYFQTYILFSIGVMPSGFGRELAAICTSGAQNQARVGSPSAEGPLEIGCTSARLLAFALIVSGQFVE